ncbi:MAG: rRNA maturation RNase YbeY [Bacteroidales bacterium]|nr:rRNA maturation RNase YbeY [Bacteroidales bacterium]
MIQFRTIDVMMPTLDWDRVRCWITSVIDSAGFKVGELHYLFCSDEALLNINRERLGHDFYTDIVTFPLDECNVYISSEFCISLDRVAENCFNFGRSFDNELLRVMIHGVLHLTGFDDQTESDRLKMRSQEELCLKLFENIDNQ